MAKYKITAKGAHQLKQEESCRLKRYYCSAGKPTIGYGHVIKEGEPIVITQAQAEAYFVVDVEDRIKILDEFKDLKPHEADALLIFIYNIGVNAWNASTARRRLKRGDRKAIPGEMKRWIHVKENGVSKVCDGLVNRQNRTAKLFEKGEYSW